MGEHTGPTSTAACDPMEERDAYVSHARVNEEGSVGNGPGGRLTAGRKVRLMAQCPGASP